MKIQTLEELTCKHFNVTREQLHEKQKKCTDEVAVAKHCMRTVAVVHFGIAPKELVEYFKIDHSTIAHSKKTILVNGVFEQEYNEFKAYVTLKDNSVVVDEKSKIERMTNDAYDERFYVHPSKVNPRTNTPYFPAFHFITKMGSPEPIGLTKWRQDKGHFADYILERSAEIGSYVHDCIDTMIKNGTVIESDTIYEAFPNAKEAHRVRESLHGFINFIAAEEPIILASEQMMCGDDFGFTLDSIMRLKSDKYKNKWVVDWKTSKVANDDHKMQVEAMRRVSECDRAMVVVLGNATKKKYTATPVPINKQDFLWNKFCAVKDTAYVELIARNTIAPRKDDIPQKFSLNGLNVTRKL